MTGTNQGTIKTKSVAKRYPPVSGLTAETTKQEGRQWNLVAERGSLVARRQKKGL